jgi:hypothetical protein
VKIHGGMKCKNCAIYKIKGMYGNEIILKSTSHPLVWNTEFNLSRELQAIIEIPTGKLEEGYNFQYIFLIIVHITVFCLP